MMVCVWIHLVGSLSTRVFDTRTATGSKLFSLLTCFYTTTFTLLSIFSPLQMISIKIWETPLSWHAKCSLPVAVRVSKTRVLKLPNIAQSLPEFKAQIMHWDCRPIGGFHVTSSPPCWWTKTKDLSLASFVRPPEIVHYSIVICVSRDWLQTNYSAANASTSRCLTPKSPRS